MKEEMADNSKEKVNDIIAVWENEAYCQRAGPAYSVKIKLLICNSDEVARISSFTMDEKHAGYVMCEDGKYSLFHNDMHSKRRSHFTLAHQFGHCLLHGDIVGPGVNDSKSYKTVTDLAWHNPDITEQHEKEASEFASRILVLKTRLSGFLKVQRKSICEIAIVDKNDRSNVTIMDKDTIEFMAEVFLVSEEVMTSRLCMEDLDDMRTGKPFEREFFLTKAGRKVYI